MKTVLISFSDSTNIGDLMIVESLEQNLLKSDNYKVFSFNFNEKNKEINGGPLVNHTITKRGSYFKKFRKLKFVDLFVNNYIQNKLRKKFESSNIAEEINKADYLIVGGGNTVFDLSYYSNSTYKLKLIFDTANKFNKKVFITSIGIGPFYRKNQLENAVGVLSDAEVITVRDEKTYNYLIDAGLDNVYQSIDPVFMYQYPLKFQEKIKKNEDTCHIGISIIDLSINKNPEEAVRNYNNSMVKLINDLATQKGNIIHLYSSEPKDNDVIESIYNDIDNKSNIVLENIDKKEDLFNLYQTLDYIIGTRMHSLIIGLTFNIPVIGISWQPKVIELFKLLNITEFVVSLEDFNKSSDVVLEKLAQLESGSMEMDTEKLLMYAKQKFDINIKLLEGFKETVMRDRSE